MEKKAILIKVKMESLQKKNLHEVFKRLHMIIENKYNFKIKSVLFCDNHMDNFITNKVSIRFQNFIQ